MRKVTSVLKKSSCSSSCGPCYTPDRCAENAFYADDEVLLNYGSVIGGGFNFQQGSATFTSCISYTDAVNTARYEAYRDIFYPNNPALAPNWGAWMPVFSNNEISATAYCQCGWTGEDQTVTIPAGTFTNYWTRAEANAAAYESALTQAQNLLDCTSPSSPPDQ